MGCSNAYVQACNSSAAIAGSLACIYCSTHTADCGLRAGRGCNYSCSWCQQLQCGDVSGSKVVGEVVARFGPHLSRLQICARVSTISASFAERRIWEESYPWNIFHQPSRHHRCHLKDTFHVPNITRQICLRPMARAPNRPQHAHAAGH
jgi:hypothetical protein